MKLGRLLTIKWVINNITQIFKEETLPLDKLAALIGLSSPVYAYCYVYRGPLAIPNEELVTIPWQAERADTEGWWSLSDPENIIIPPAGKGLVLANLYLQWAQSAIGMRYCALAGALEMLEDIRLATGFVVEDYTLTGLMPCSGAFPITAAVAQDSGAELELLYASLQLARIGQYPL